MDYGRISMFNNNPEENTESKDGISVRSITFTPDPDKMAELGVCLKCGVLKTEDHHVCGHRWADTRITLQAMVYKINGAGDFINDTDQH